MKRDRGWTGILKHGAGWRATVTQGRDKPRVMKHFPKATDPRLMQRWRADTKAALRVTRKARATMGSFAFDAKRYLTLVTALPTYKDRVREIAFWIGEFGTKDRSTITSADIRGIRDRLLTKPRGMQNCISQKSDTRPLAPATVNKRLRALRNLYTVLDGSRADNPVRDVPEAPEPDQAPKALDYAVIRQILDAIPDAGRAEKGKARGTVSLTKLRLTCLAYCPITPKQLSQLQPADLQLDHGLIRLPARQKGRGAKAVWVPLLPAARAAFARFDHAQAYGRFSQSSLRKSFARAARKVTPEKVWPYRLRHSFGTLAFLATGNLEAVGSMMQHAQKTTTMGYAMGAKAAVMAAHMETVATTLASQIGATGHEPIGTSVDFSGLSDRPLTPLPTHTRGGNKKGRPRK